jgi:type IV pilus assembly protein PilN
MRNLDSSPVLTNPQLIEIKAVDVNKRRVAEFNLNISIERAAPEDEKPASSQSGPAAGGKKS